MPNLQEQNGRRMKINNQVNNLLVFQMLYVSKTLEVTVDHDGDPSAQSFTLLHAACIRSHFNAHTL